MKRSLNRGTTEACESVRKRECTSWESTVSEALSSLCEWTHHGHGVKLLKRAHCPEKQNDDSTTLDSLDRPSEEVGCEGLKVLENEHAKRLTEDLLRILVVTAGKGKG